MALTKSCRLCSFSCDEYKNLYDENGEANMIYQIAAKFFNTSLMDSETDLSLRIICSECWQHINDFHNFQQWILNAQTQQEDFKMFVIKVENSDDDQMSIIDINDSDLSDNDAETNATTNSSDLLNNKNENYDNYIAKLKGKLICDKCLKLFPNFASLEAHFQDFHPNDKFYAICCREKFIERCTFVEHLLADHNKKRQSLFKCEICGSSFTFKGNLRRHIKRKHALQPILKYVCKYCNKMFKNRQELESHKYEMHATILGNNLENTSDIDDECFDIDSESDDELSATSNSVSFSNVSNECNLEMNSSSTSAKCTAQIHRPTLEIFDMKEEFLTDGENEADASSSMEKNDKEELHDEFKIKWSMILKCPKCEENLENYYQLSEHFERYHPEERCYINCCRILLNDNPSIVDHLRFHEDANAFKCEQCGKCFKHSRGLNSHKVQSHSEKRSTLVRWNYSCNCPLDKKLQDDNAKEKILEYDTIVCCHRKKKILEEDSLIAQWRKEIKCQMCNLTFPYYSLMRDHFYQEHPGELCFTSCCQRNMSRIAEVVEHVRYHLDPDAYRCTPCNLKFTTKSGMVRHMRNAHNGDNLPKHKWACDECNKSFEKRHVLTRHKNVVHSKLD